MSSSRECALNCGIPICSCAATVPGRLVRDSSFATMFLRPIWSRLSPAANFQEVSSPCTMDGVRTKRRYGCRNSERSFSETSHRDRAIQGASGRREAATAGKGQDFRGDAAQGKTRFGESEVGREAVEEAFVDGKIGCGEEGRPHAQTLGVGAETLEKTSRMLPVLILFPSGWLHRFLGFSISFLRRQHVVVSDMFPKRVAKIRK
jgi:hypothetical protein